MAAKLWEVKLIFFKQEKIGLFNTNYQSFAAVELVFLQTVRTNRGRVCVCNTSFVTALPQSKNYVFLGADDLIPAHQICLHTQTLYYTCS